ATCNPGRENGRPSGDSSVRILKAVRGRAVSTAGELGGGQAMTKAVHVRTPCRLHFGMFSFGSACRAQFGGVGVMVEPPYVEVQIEPASSFSVTGSVTQQQRTEFVVDRLVGAWELGSLPPCEVRVTSPRDHTGLGVGTQLSLAIAAGLRRFLGF